MELSPFFHTSGEIPDYSKLKDSYEFFMHSAENNLEKLKDHISENTKCVASNFQIKSRVKSFESFYAKLLRKLALKEPLNGSSFFSLITDMIAVRIICPFINDIDEVLESLKKNYDVVEIESKGSKLSSSEFAYSSVHVLIKLPKATGRFKQIKKHVRLEIQLRTILQEAWSEVEHELIYKMGAHPLNSSIRRKLAALNANLTLSDMLFQEIREDQKNRYTEILERRSKFLSTTNSEGNLHPENILVTDDKEALPQSSALTPQGSYASKKEEELLVAALESHIDGRIDDSINLYTQCLETNISRKTRSIVYNHRGMAYSALGKNKSALADFSLAYGTDINNIRSLMNRGFTHRKIKKFPLALQDFDRVIQINPYLSEAYYGRALTYKSLDHNEQCYNDCQKALSLEPDFEQVKKLMKQLDKTSLMSNQDNEGIDEDNPSNKSLAN